MLKLQTIVASTRPGRAGLSIGSWFHDVAAARKDFQAGLIDLKAVNLPLFDEPHHPRMLQYVHQHTKDWSATIDAADAFVIVMPEYNHGFTASIKNALDYLSHEWADKPVGFVSYGGVSAGTRAVQLLKPVTSALGLVAAGEVNIPFFAQYRKDDAFAPPESFTDSANLMLDRIAKVGATLKAGRKELVAA
ncbi:NADPH-dependent FMN reductase [Kaistia nematophila]|uniref:NAD(P)H-dependent oxidoreductase n=1 Tax=Kaistia nematophila TaxID=2994654 RepID=A0A9X3E4X1_9HYPH|nr:NAD(P)H-dependent oxidoreductase [Kaistia nematophila]MCX5570817.1 NAD(P)H-dependent oxidoreductase [Kaistia nematophila]